MHLENRGVVFAARYDEQRLDGPVHFHYVAPSFWAWKGGEARLKGLAKFVDHVLCILPNEEPVCRSNGLPATFVGHPILEDVLEINLVSSYLLLLLHVLLSSLFYIVAVFCISLQLLYMWTFVPIYLCIFQLF